ncbi:unnamed protein product [Tuber melanosporum]|uniref:(Perigord truffle) hypothetical protein n=1 Tax=Tuber melanosporum (strain Mel28) TaxID=656061 RepID=D5GQ34_TUBMM|nr:uncharacterized protein GSTUM_00012181001 [Tuber melanosporum]CAZ86627.1 unnamed protein product [Tuber melanosporum]
MPQPSHTPHPNITIAPPTPLTIPLLKRLNTLLLPIPYPQTFYSEILPSPLLTRLTRLAFYNPPPSSSPSAQPICIGAIRCRLEPHGKLYVMTLCTLSPYRGLGVAGRLLEAVVGSGVREVYAHVWEMNVEGIGWYARRGFEVGAVVGGYYRRLRPDGARVVRRWVGVVEWVGKEGVVEEDEGEESGDEEEEEGREGEERFGDGESVRDEKSEPEGNREAQEGSGPKHHGGDGGEAVEE